MYQTLCTTLRINPILAHALLLETKLKNISESQEKQLRKLFAEFDHGGDNLISYEELQSGLILLKKSPSQKALNRIMKTAHLSAAPKNHIEFKGFALALLSRRSVLYDFLYEGYDTAEELEVSGP